MNVHNALYTPKHAAVIIHHSNDSCIESVNDTGLYTHRQCAIKKLLINKLTRTGRRGNGCTCTIDLWRISPASKAPVPSVKCLCEITLGLWMTVHNKLCRWRRSKSKNPEETRWKTCVVQNVTQLFLLLHLQSLLGTIIHKPLGGGTYPPEVYSILTSGRRHLSWVSRSFWTSWPSAGRRVGPLPRLSPKANSNPGNPLPNTPCSTWLITCHRDNGSKSRAQRWGQVGGATDDDAHVTINNPLQNSAKLTLLYRTVLN